MDDDKFVISVDLGANGAIAIFGPKKRKPEIYDIPTYKQEFGNKGTKAYRTEMVYDGTALAAIFKPFRRPALRDNTVVVLEKQITKLTDSLKTVRKVFEGYGLFRGICFAYGLHMELVNANQWKKMTGLQGKSKEASRHLAMSLWPNFQNCKSPHLKSGQFGLDRKKDHDRAEAMLLGRWWRLGGVNGKEQPEAFDPDPPKPKKKRTYKKKGKQTDPTMKGVK